jgi:hypothetical protein
LLSLLIVVTSELFCCKPRIIVADYLNIFAVINYDFQGSYKIAINLLQVVVRAVLSTNLRVLAS